MTEVSWQGDVAALALLESEPWRGLGDAISIDSEDSEQVPSEIDVLDFMCPMMLEDDLEPEPACSQREDFIEVFSQPRLVPKAQELALGFNASKSIDILTGWDLLTEANQKATMEHFRSKKPRSCMLSPPCTMFSQLMNTNFPRMDPIVVKKRWKDALTLCPAHLPVHDELRCNLRPGTPHWGIVLETAGDTTASEHAWNLFGDFSPMQIWVEGSHFWVPYQKKHPVDDKLTYSGTIF